MDGEQRWRIYMCRRRVFFFWRFVGNTGCYHEIRITKNAWDGDLDCWGRVLYSTWTSYYFFSVYFQVQFLNFKSSRRLCDLFASVPFFSYWCVLCHICEIWLLLANSFFCIEPVEMVIVWHVFAGNVSKENSSRSECVEHLSTVVEWCVSHIWGAGS